MNPVERAFEWAVGYPIDWVATGGWAAALATAGAVYIAARLNEIGAIKAERRRRSQQIAALAAIYFEALRLTDAMVRAAEWEPRSIPELGPETVGLRGADPAQVSDLIEALRDVPVLELPNFVAARHVFAVRRVLTDLLGDASDFEQGLGNPRSIIGRCNVERAVVNEALVHIMTHEDARDPILSE